MRIIREVHAMQEWSRSCRRDGLRVGLVPTMGYLHAGHLSLVHLARERADRIVVSVFVNPTQFGPSEDLSAYPRDFDRDESLCRDAGAAAIFCPDVGQMYSADFSTWVVEERLSAPLCGASRPGHFRGVTTVVAKLFNAVLPDVAVFGRKDAQQALIIERMTRDLGFPVEIVVGPTVREADGLAMSSRNKYLDNGERVRAVSIFGGLKRAQGLFAAGERDAAVLARVVSNSIQAAGGRIDYVEVRECAGLRSVARIDGPCLLAVAAYFGKARLIDNCFLTPRV